MNITLLKRAAIQSFALMMTVVTLSIVISQYRFTTIAAPMDGIDKISQGDINNDKIDKNLDSGVLDKELLDDIDGLGDILIPPDLLAKITPQIYTNLSNKFLMIKKPMGNNLRLSLDDLFMSKSIKLTLRGLVFTNIDYDMIKRVHNNEIFIGQPQYIEVTEYINNAKSNEVTIRKEYGNDLAHEVTISYQFDTTAKSYSAEILIKLDNNYTHTIYENDEYFIINLRNPREVYDKILVIDPGHGGRDVGAPSRDQLSFEKDMNLMITVLLKELLDQEDIKVYYTRLKDEHLFLRPRISLANSLDADFFISIHNNASEFTSPNGTEILYYDTHFKGVSAEKLSRVFLEELSKTTTLRQRGLVKLKNDDIFILEHATVPAVLLEIAYMTNSNDIAYLRNEGNRRAIAKGIYNGIMRAYDEFELQLRANKEVE